MKPGKVGNAAAMVYKFCKIIEVGDQVITYDPKSREYLLGIITSDYQFMPDNIEDYPHIRKVDWKSRISRDDLTVSSRNSLGATLTLFAMNDDVNADITSVASGDRKEIVGEDYDDESELLDSVKDQSREFIKDRISLLDHHEFEHLVAGVLRAMGYKTNVSQIGPDRGIDIIASPDGFGFESPRIVVECKHRKGLIGAQEIRSFLGGRHKDDKGLYVSTRWVYEGCTL